MALEVGMKVGAKRWPYSSAHPDAWSTPHSGFILSIRSPEAWKGTMAFGDRLPTQEEVDLHLAKVGLKDASSIVPVQWDFDGKKVVHWEAPEALTHYFKDLEAWAIARGNARIDHKFGFRQAA